MAAPATTISTAPAAAPVAADEVETRLAGMERALATVEGALEPYLSTPVAGIAASLAPLDTARLNTLFAFAATSLLYVHHRIGGDDMQGSEAMAEVEAVRRLFGRIDETHKLLVAREGKAVSQLDAPAAKRMIAAGISGAGGGSGDDDAAGGVGTKRPRPPATDGQGDDGDDGEMGGRGAAGQGRKVGAGAARAGGHRGHGRGGGRRDSRDHGDQGARGGGGGGGGKHAKVQHGHGGGGGGGDDAKRTTPQPTLSHLHWRQEMEAKFGKQGGALGAGKAGR